MLAGGDRACGNVNRKEVFKVVLNGVELGRGSRGRQMNPRKKRAAVINDCNRQEDG